MVPWRRMDVMYRGTSPCSGNHDTLSAVHVVRLSVRDVHDGVRSATGIWRLCPLKG